MEKFRVLVMKTTYSTAEVVVQAESEDEALDKALDMALDCIDDEDYEINNQEFSAEIGRSFKQQKLIFHHGGHDHMFSFVPSEEDFWTSFMSEGYAFDVHYDEEDLSVCVYLLVEGDNGKWEQYVNAVHKQEVKL